ncbi:MAG: hypothetical protein WCD18_20735 [Thermosynechococcaceae cyanobacterium]
MLWHSKICDRLARLETEQERITQGHEQLAAEQARFKAVAIALNTKLDKKARTADGLFNRAQQFDKAVHRCQFRNRLYVLFELAERWMVWMVVAAIACGFGFYGGVRMLASDSCLRNNGCRAVLIWVLAHPRQVDRK